MLEEENDFIENTSLKLNSNMTTYSISAFNDDASTYMGVKSVNEEQSITITNKKQKDKIKKNKKANSFSSIIESSNSSNSDAPSKKKKSSNKLSKQKNNEKERNNNKNSNKQENEKEKEIEKIKTLFEWDGGGQEVYLTGSFCDWKQFFKMDKNDNGKFSLVLDLPRGFHQYKFKIDEKWEFSKNHLKFEENGNINNYIDTTDYQNEDENKLIEEDKNKKSDNNKNKTIEKEEKKGIEKPEEKNNIKVNNKSPGKKKKKNKKRLSSTHSVNFLNSQNNYTIYYPLKSELNIKPSTLPSLYKAHFILNEDFKPKKERKFTKIEYVNDSSNSESSESSSSSSSSETSSESISKVTIFGEIVPYVKFQNLYHIHSNHLHSKMVKNKYSNVISMTSRYRIKFSTFIYYKPYISQEKTRKKHSKTVKIKVKKPKQKQK